MGRQRERERGGEEAGGEEVGHRRRKFVFVQRATRQLHSCNC